jgi:hypothetical protein
MKDHPIGAPIRAGEASPLRVATSGEANGSSQAPRRCSPARPNKRRGHAVGSRGKASPLRGSETGGHIDPDT